MLSFVPGLLKGVSKASSIPSEALPIEAVFVKFEEPWLSSATIASSTGLISVTFLEDGRYYLPRLLFLAAATRSPVIGVGEAF
jgi:hypothetical protein